MSNNIIKIDEKKIYLNVETNALYYRVSSSGINDNKDIIKNNNNIYTFITHNEKELFDCNINDCNQSGETKSGYIYTFTLQNLDNNTIISKSTNEGYIYIKVPINNEIQKNSNGGNKNKHRRTIRKNKK